MFFVPRHTPPKYRPKLLADRPAGARGRIDRRQVDPFFDPPDKSESRDQGEKAERAGGSSAGLVIAGASVTFAVALAVSRDPGVAIMAGACIAALGAALTFMPGQRLLSAIVTTAGMLVCFSSGDPVLGLIGVVLFVFTIVIVADPKAIFKLIVDDD